MDEGLKIIRSGAWRAHPELVMPLMRCSWREGNEAITIIDFAVFDGWREIVVDSGPQNGCRGFVERESVIR